MAVQWLATPLLIAASLALLYRLAKIGRRPPDYPPGPPTLPFIGNLHLMPKEHIYLQLQKWAEEYGYVCARCERLGGDRK